MLNLRRFVLLCGLTAFACSGARAIEDAPALEAFSWVLPSGMVPEYRRAEAGEHPFVETVPEVVARGQRGGVLTLAYLGKVSLTGGRRPLDYFRRGRSQYLRDYLETVTDVVGQAGVVKASRIEQGSGWTAAHFHALHEGDVILYYRVMFEPHVVEVMYRAPAEEEVLAQLRMENFLQSLQPPSGP